MRDKLKADIASAMKAKDKDRVTTLRGIWAVAQDVALKDKRKDVSNVDVISAAKKAVKEGNEGMDIYRVIDTPIANENYTRNYRLANLAAEYLPTNISTDEMSATVEAIINELISQDVVIGMKTMGPIMKAVKDKYPDGNYDGKELSTIVRAKLV